MHRTTIKTATAVSLRRDALASFPAITAVLWTVLVRLRHRVEAAPLRAAAAALPPALLVGVRPPAALPPPASLPPPPLLLLLLLPPLLLPAAPVLRPRQLVLHRHHLRLQQLPRLLQDLRLAVLPPKVLLLLLVWIKTLFRHSPSTQPLSILPLLHSWLPR